MHVEDRLQEIYFKSRLLSEHMKARSKFNLATVFEYVQAAEKHLKATVFCVYMLFFVS